MIREQVADFFAPDGVLSRPHQRNGRPFVYELRPQQTAMALAVAEVLDGKRNLCVEAPTGVGKTFAYLIPALFHARETGKAVVISTHTIQLQEQIFSSDIPLIEEMLGTRIQAQVAKGRSHYLCLRRLNDLFDMDQGMFDWSGAAGELSRLQQWADRTESGDQADLPGNISPQLWNLVCCERGNCAGGKCPCFKKCYLQRAKRRLKDAEIVISNHAKFFTELAMDEEEGNSDGGDGSFPEYDGVILDEAHTIEDTAGSHLGLRAESYLLRAALNRLYSPERHLGVFAQDAYGSLRDAVTYCRQAYDLFFPKLMEWVAQQQRNPLRYQVPNHIPNYMADPLEMLVTRLKEFLSGRDLDATMEAEVTAALQTLQEQQEALATFFAMSEPDCVYWFELEGGAGGRRQEISLNVVPVDVAPVLRERLFSRAPVILTSATLAVNGSINYFQKRIGCEDAENLVLDTPFDYMRQAELFIAKEMPPPREEEGFLVRASDALRYFLQKTGGRAFVLFTSYRMMQKMAEMLDDFFRREKMKVFLQGEQYSPRKMLEKFRTTDRAVIFGTASFWTGVDVPGDALCNVILTRLPFSVPDHPLIEARTERIASQGGNPFMQYSVPEAILKFRQGFGRLIRTKQDKGIVVILDSRVVNSFYGRQFLQSIPACPVEYF